jgi:hypothetical protein
MNLIINNILFNPDSIDIDSSVFSSSGFQIPSYATFSYMDDKDRYLWDELIHEGIKFDIFTPSMSLLGCFVDEIAFCQEGTYEVSVTFDVWNYGEYEHMMLKARRLEKINQIMKK